MLAANTPKKQQSLYGPVGPTQRTDTTAVHPLASLTPTHLTPHAAAVASPQPDRYFPGDQIHRPLERIHSTVSSTPSKSGHFSRHSAGQSNALDSLTVQLTSMLQHSLEKSQETTTHSLYFAAQARTEARQDLDRIIAYERKLAEANAAKKALELTFENKMLQMQLHAQSNTPADTVPPPVTAVNLTPTTAVSPLVDAPAPPPIVPPATDHSSLSVNGAVASDTASLPAVLPSVPTDNDLISFDDVRTHVSRQPADAANNNARITASNDALPPAAERCNVSSVGSAPCSTQNGPAANAHAASAVAHAGLMSMGYNGQFFNSYGPHPFLYNPFFQPHVSPFVPVPCDNLTANGQGSLPPQMHGPPTNATTMRTTAVQEARTHAPLGSTATGLGTANPNVTLPTTKGGSTSISANSCTTSIAPPPATLANDAVSIASLTTSVPPAQPSDTAVTSSSAAPAETPLASTTAITTSSSTQPAAATAAVSADMKSSPSSQTPAVTATPTVVVKQLQPVRPYNGSTSWRSFKSYFDRVARINNWTTDQDKVQALVLALEPPATDLLKDLDDTSSTALNDIWSAIEKRFGSVDETRSAQRSFDNRRQLDAENLAQFELALRSLYRQAWPNASAETRDSTLKHRFEHGLNSPELAQYLRIHAREDDFAATVLKARQFMDAVDSTRPKKAVRIVTNADHSNAQPEINTIKSEPDFQPLINGIKAVIDKALSQTSKPADNSIATSTKDDSGDFSHRRLYSPTPTRAGNSVRGPSPGPQQNNHRRFDTARERPEQRNTPYFGSSSRPNNDANRAGPQPRNNGSNQTRPRPPSIGRRQLPPVDQRRTPLLGAPRPQQSDNTTFDRTFAQNSNVASQRRTTGCWICGTYGCHSANHAPMHSTPQPATRTRPSENQMGVLRSGQRHPAFTGRQQRQ